MAASGCRPMSEAPLPRGNWRPGSGPCNVTRIAMIPFLPLICACRQRRLTREMEAACRAQSTQPLSVLPRRPGDPSVENRATESLRIGYRWQRERHLAVGNDFKRGRTEKRVDSRVHQAHVVDVSERDFRGRHGLDAAPNHETAIG